MRNTDHKIIYASSSSLPPPPQYSSPPEVEAHIPILINNIVDTIEVRMFPNGGEEIVVGRPESIGVPEGYMPPLPIPLIPYLTDNESGVVNDSE